MSSKIAFVIPSLKKRGGLEKYCIRLAENFSRNNTVSIVTGDCNRSETFPCELIELRPFSSMKLARMLSFELMVKNYFRKTPYDIIFGMDRSFYPQTHHRAGNGVHAAWLDRRKKLTPWLRGISFALNPFHQLTKAMEQHTFEQVEKLFTNSHMVKEEVLQYYPKVTPEKIAVVHNGVEWHELQKPFEESISLRKTLIKRYNLSYDAYQFLFVGNEYLRKGLLLLFRALSLLTDTNFQLSIVGKERNLEFFKYKAREYGLHEEQVRFFGEAQSAIPFYQIADCLVIPSLYDPFANVTVEALAMGLFVVSSASNGGSEVITSDDMGLVFHDLMYPDELAHSLWQAMQYPKTAESAHNIRHSIKHLDFAQQLQKFVVEMSR